MDDAKTTARSRRVLLQAGLAAIGGGVARHAWAQEKVAQAMMMYQDHPKDGHQCSGCAQFIAPDQCKVVQGPISPNGWCAAFVAKG